MNSVKIHIALILCTLTFTVSAQQTPASFVDPFIGTGGHGHTFPGATAPFGMVQLSPDTRLEGWDGCGGYHYSDEYIYGFSHTHLSGTGVPDYCDILFMPFSGETRLNNGADGKPGYRSRFSHADETASAGYYSVMLKEHNILAELTATTRTGMYRYTFAPGKDQKVLVDLKHRDQVTDSWIRITGPAQVEGYRGSTGWARDQRVYFAVSFSRPFKDFSIALNDSLLRGAENTEGKNVKAWFTFDEKDGQVLIVKIGLSAVSAENARKNLEAEVTDFDFDRIRNQTLQLWNGELGKIKISTENQKDMTVFYTALYHTMICPNTYNDVDGSFLGRDMKVHNAGNDQYYTVFSLWDTYRALHPLMTIIDHRRTNDFIRTFIRQYQQGGMLPVWELSANETWCMIGYHAVPVIADAYMKGIRGYDEKEALKAMVNSASKDYFGLDNYRKYGYIPAEKEHESVSKTLEYAFDDWCIARVAGALGNDSLQKAFTIRAQSYKHLFDPSTSFMRARFNGGWFNPFTPSEVNFNYTEANAWQYSFAAPHDMDGFITLHGGKEKTARFIDQLFSAPSQTTGRDQSDITGLIGQYAHGNEPSHHIAYLYNYCGQPWKTQQMAHRIMDDFYTTAPDGLIGNEDCGQMSAWAVFSGMGFYPVCPGSTQYAIGTPRYKEAVISLENGQTFNIRARNLSTTNYFIQRAFLNGKEYNRSYLDHSDIMNGGELIFEMGPTPSHNWGTGLNNEPSTGIEGEAVLPAPVCSPSEKIFRNSLEIELSAEPGATIYYSTGGYESGEPAEIYKSAILINQSTSLRFMAVKPGFRPTAIQEALFTKMPEGIEMVSVGNYAPQYSGSGKDNVIDGLKGGTDFRLGGWQGFEGTDAAFVMKLSGRESVRSISIGCLQDINSWIFMPASIELYASENGEHFTKIKTISNTFPNDRWGTFTEYYHFENLNLSQPYIKIVLVNRGPCPEWHPGNGNATWIFTDEIEFTF